MIEDFDKTIDKWCSELLQQAGEFAQNHARHTLLFRHGSKFDEKITTYPIHNGQIVMSGAPWSSYLEYGNNQGGSRIFAKNHKYMTFKIDGEWVKVKSVRAHGKLPFMQNAAEATEKAIPGIWAKIT